MKTRAFVVLVLAVLLLSVYTDGLAQITGGSLNGRVADSSGAIIPGVGLTLRSSAIQGERTAFTDESGNYRFILLPPGNYSLTYELPGFKTLIRDGIVVAVGRTTTLNVELEVATIAETVTVTGESPVVDVQNATVGVNFSQSLLRDLPNQRDLWAVLTATPGMSMTRYDIGGSTMGTQTGYRAYGMQRQSWINMDGVNTTEGDGGAGGYWDYAVFGEVQVSAAANSAEVPVPGAFVNAVYKSGSNELHGEMYFDFEDPKFQGGNMTDSLRNQGIFEGDKFLRFRSYNVQAGGPVIRDKFWWFMSWSDQYSLLQTELRHNDGTPGASFSTSLRNPTIKLNYQLNPDNSLIFSAQSNRKHQPFRGGQGADSAFYIVDSTYNQLSWEWVGKVQWTSVLSNRTTLDVSINNFGYHFPGKPRVNATPTFDEVTQLRRGGYEAPFRSLRRRWHSDAKMSRFQDNFLGGSHEIKLGGTVDWEAPRRWSLEAPFTAGMTEGSTRLIYANGRPSKFEVMNTPLRDATFMWHNSAFFQDKWQIGRRLTANIGIRFDSYQDYLPPQGNTGTGLAVTPGPFAVPVDYPKQTISTLNRVVPRLGLIFDPFGNTKTAIKLAYGRYSENVATRIAGLANPNKRIIKTYAWDGTLPVTPALVARLVPQKVDGQAREIAVDPDLSNAYTDEYVAGIEHQFIEDLGFNFNFVRKIRKNTWAALNRAEPFSAFAPVAAIDPGLDGRMNTTDDHPFTVFERMVPAGSDMYLTNIAGHGDNYTTFAFGLTKRLSNKWQMLTAFDWTKRNIAHNISNDPNTMLHGADSGQHSTGWSYKVLGSYTLPKDFGVSASYYAQKGEPYGRRVRFAASNLAGRTRNLSQGAVTLYVEPVGTYHYPDTHLVNLRLEKSFSMGERQKITGMFDLFNGFNFNTVLGVDTLTGTVTDRHNSVVPRFGRATQIMNPRIFRLGVRYVF